MNILQELSTLRSVCQKRYSAISVDGKPIYVFHIPVSSCTIWGGNGDKDVDDYFYISKDGWLVCHITTETGLYQKGSGEVEHTEQSVSDEYVQSRLNGECELSSVEALIGFYNSIKDKHREDFR